MAVGAIFAALNTMYSAVSTRLVEIGTLRALGFKGSTVLVSLMIEAMMVPLNAIGEMDGVSYVLIVSKGKVKLNEVEVVEETSNYARIISGLSSGLKVVARFDYELEDGQKVTIN